VRPDGYVFSPAPDGSQPLMPDSVTGRLNRLSKKVGVKVNLRSLRHYAATEMLTNGVDLRTAAGRLGHGDGGTTTLRVYTHFLPAPDLKPPKSSPTQSNAHPPARTRRKVHGRTPPS
jgi:integrase